MASANWLARFVDREGDSPANEVWGFANYGIATDAICLLAVEGATGEPLELVQGSGVRRGVSDLVGEPVPSSAEATTLGDLWAWLDRVERAQCRACRGSGHVHSQGEVVTVGSEPFPCVYCDGDGWWFPLAQPGREDADTVIVAGAALDRNRLAWWLPAELGDPNDPVRLWSLTRANGARAACFAGARWKMFVRDLDANHAATRKGANYRTYAPGAGAWYETRRQAPPAVHPGTDWFIERGYDPAGLVKMWGEPAST